MRPGDKRIARRALQVPRDAFVPLWVGRLEEEKDPEAFVRAIGRMSNVPTVALVAGDGPLRTCLADTVARLGLTQRIRFLGWCSDIRDAALACDVFASTSKWEGFPLAPIEVGSVGRPLVLSSVAGNVDVADDGVPAQLVSPGDDEAFARALKRMADRDAARVIGRETGKRIRGTFDPVTMTREVERVYASVR